MSIVLVKEISKNQRSWRNSKEIQRWTRGSELLSEADQVHWLQKIESDPRIQMFGIIVEPPKKVWSIGGQKYREGEINAGTCGLTGIDKLHRTAEFSLLIAPEYQRKGYGRAALKELLKYGFMNLGLECIWGETFVYTAQGDQPEEINPAWKLFQEIGFKEEGRLRSRYYKQGQRIDTICFSILRSEWA